MQPTASPPTASLSFGIRADAEGIGASCRRLSIVNDLSESHHPPRLSSLDSHEPFLLSVLRGFPDPLPPSSTNARTASGNRQAIEICYKGLSGAAGEVTWTTKAGAKLLQQRNLGLLIRQGRSSRSRRRMSSPFIAITVGGLSRARCGALMPATHRALESPPTGFHR